MNLRFLFLCLKLTSTSCGQPNFIVLVTDDQRWDTVGVNDPKVALATPHMDRLAKEGVNFETGFVTTPICSVSRASILSGRYSRNNGIHEFLIPMSDEVFAASYPAQLKKAGYHIGQLGKYGVGATPKQIAFFDVFDTDWEKQNPNTYTYTPYGPRPQTNAPGIDWQRYQKAWPKPYEKIAAEVKKLGVTWEDALENPATRETIGKAVGWYY